MKLKHVVFHRPGNAWQEGVVFREQPGVMEHVKHYSVLQAEGKLFMGGPFVEGGSGGMMIASEQITKEELEEFAAQDPAVKSGLLQYEIKTWFIAMD